MELFVGLFILIYVMFILVFAGVPYVLRALGLYQLAKNQQFENPWLAWIPIGDSYILGRLAKNSPYVKRKIPNIHIILPSLLGMYVAIYIAFMVYFFSNIPMLPYSMSDNLFSYAPFLIFYILFILFALLVSAVYYFTLHHVYKSYDPQNNVLYTVLTIIFRLSFVFLFVIRNKEMVFTDDEVLEE